MKIIGNIIKILAVAVIVVFSVLNSDPVKVVYTFNPDEAIQVPLFIVVLLSAIAGIAVTGVVSLADRFRSIRQNNQLRKQLKQAEEEIQRLRNLPLVEDESTRGATAPVGGASSETEGSNFGVDDDSSRDTYGA